MRIIVLLISFMLVAGVVLALDAVQIPSKNLMVTWDEPTLDALGRPLTDLAKVVIRTTLDGVALVDAEAPVSGPTGGQEGFHTYLNVCQPNTEPEVVVEVYMVDFAGNESDAAIIPKTIDCVPPGKAK